MTRASRFLRSPRLALGLCIVLALYAALGTISGGAERFGSPLFIALVSLLALNVGFCTWHRLPLALRAPSRRGPAPILDALMHLSLIVLLAGGALKAAQGFVGTQYLFPGQLVTTVRAGGTGAETPIGFGLLLKERAEDYYPANFQIGIRDARTGAKLALLVVREGGEASLPHADLRLAVGAYPGAGQSVKARATSAGVTEEILLETVPGEGAVVRSGDYEIVLVAWRRDLRMVRGRVAVVDGGGEVKEAWLAVGGRIAHRGASVFLTAWGEDPFRNPYLGIQVSRDPGAPVFWAGAVLLAVTMPLYLLVRGTGASRRAVVGLQPPPEA